jgi:uncharacterized protein
VTASSPTAEPIALGLFTWPSEAPRLIGGRCGSCGAVAFPRPPSCARCTSSDIDEQLLAPRGTLWSWTVQRFRPKDPYIGPEPFEPYGVGYVDLDGEVLVEARLTMADTGQVEIDQLEIGKLEIGQPMELVVVPFATRDDGAELVTFAFRPCSGEAQR